MKNQRYALFVPYIEELPIARNNHHCQPLRMQLTFLNVDALLFQKLPKLLYFLFEFAYEFRVGVLVDDSFADDLLRSVCVSVIRV